LSQKTESRSDLWRLYCADSAISSMSRTASMLPLEPYRVKALQRRSTELVGVWNWHVPNLSPRGDAGRGFEFLPLRQAFDFGLTER
jgi:hypothetical protein